METEAGQRSQQLLFRNADLFFKSSPFPPHPPFLSRNVLAAFSLQASWQDLSVPSTDPENDAIYILIWGLFMRMSHGINFRLCVKFPILLFPNRIAHFTGAGLVFWQVPEVQGYMAVDLKYRCHWTSSLSLPSHIFNTMKTKIYCLDISWKRLGSGEVLQPMYHCSILSQRH